MGKKFGSISGRKVFSADVGEVGLFSNLFQDEILSNYSKAYINKGNYLWDKIFNNTPVKKAKGQVRSYGKQAMRLVDTEVGYRGGLNNVVIEAVRNNEWTLRDYGLYTEILTADVDNADSPLDAQRDGAEIVMEMMKLALENRAMTVFDESGGAVNAVEISTAADKLDHADSDPFELFQVAVNTIFQKIGRKPNNVAVTYDVYSILSTHPKVLARLTNVTIATQTQVETILASMFGIDNFYIADSQKAVGDDSFGNHSATPLTFLANSRMFFRYNEASPRQKSLSFGKAYNRKGGLRSFVVDATPERKLTDGVDSIVATKIENDLVVSVKDAGLLMYNVLATPIT